MATKTLHTLLLAAAALAWLPSVAAAKPEVTVSMKAEKEVTIVENGQETRKIVEAKDILPGEVITYTLNFRNSGDEAAKGLAVSNRIPPETIFLPGSAMESGTEVTFSIDDGKSFKKPSLLTYELRLPDGSKEKRVASPEQYTHIRWVIPSLAPQGEGSVSFKVKVK